MLSASKKSVSDSLNVRSSNSRRKRRDWSVKHFAKLNVKLKSTKSKRNARCGRSRSRMRLNRRRQRRKRSELRKNKPLCSRLKKKLRERQPS